MSAMNILSDPVASMIAIDDMVHYWQDKRDAKTTKVSNYCTKIEYRGIVESLYFLNQNQTRDAVKRFKRDVDTYRLRMQLRSGW